MNSRPFDPAGRRRRQKLALWLRAAVGMAAGGLLLCTAAAAQSRGELLYSTHCIACHSTQMHWRDKKLATNWETLREQVRRWQAVASLDWRDEDILDVTHHLNERYYHFAAARPVAGLPPARALAENGR